MDVGAEGLKVAEWGLGRCYATGDTIASNLKNAKYSRNFNSSSALSTKDIRLVGSDVLGIALCHGNSGVREAMIKR